MNEKKLTLAQLIDGYKDGSITQPMSIDNDNVHVWQPLDEDWTEVDELYEAHPEDLLEQLLDYVGIPHEHV